MARLTQLQFNKAREFLLNNARELEKSMFRYEFEDENGEEVLSALKSYQNADKGFGNALEPDIRCKESSALATTIALQYLSKINSSNKIVLVKDCFEYLIKTYNETEKGWEIITAAADQAPRAIWWNYTGFQEHWGNPNAEILGYFYEYPNLIDRSFLELLTKYCLEYLERKSSLSEMHEMFCYIRLLDRLPHELIAEFTAKMDTFTNHCVIKNPDERNGYCAVPLQIVESSSSRYYEKYSDVLAHDLDELINSQNADGAWSPDWSWGRYEEEWKVAKEEWKGYLTLNNLRTLKGFNRIDFL